MNNIIIPREDNTDKTRFNETINHELIITVEDEVKLIKQIQNNEGDFAAAKERLMRADQRFVYVIAQKYVSSYFTKEELIAEGNIGLEHAIYKFDKTRSYKFISYAVCWIRQSIQQYITEVIKSEHELLDLYARELDILRMYFGLGRKKATLEEIQVKYGLTTQRVEYIKDRAFQKLCKSKEQISEVRALLFSSSENTELE